jgi:hypothetical protein
VLKFWVAISSNQKAKCNAKQHYQHQSTDAVDNREAVIAKHYGNGENIDCLLACIASSEMSHDNGILGKSARNNLALHFIDCITAATLEAERAKNKPHLQTLWFWSILMPHLMLFGMLSRLLWETHSMV